MWLGLLVGFVSFVGYGWSREGATIADKEAEVTLHVVKLAQFTKAIEEHRGKIVVIDIWADFCIPCKKAFPHFLEMQRKYSKDGVVFVSLSVDEPGQKDKALKFLKSQKATIPNFLVDEEPAFWQDALKIGGPPAAFIYDRQGKLFRKFDSDDPDKGYDHTDVEKLIKSMLEKK